MNRRGFTLIELIAVMVVLSIILAVGVPTMINAYKDSQLEAEGMFVKELSKSIEGYISLYNTSIPFSKDYIYIVKPGEKSNMHAYKGTISVDELINKNIIEAKDYKNAGNKSQKCNATAKVIEVYRDEDFVYCHRIKKESLECLSEDYLNTISDDYVINTCEWEEVHPE